MRDKHDTKLYYSISEASAIAKVKPHVLRYWETQFKMLRPKKNKAGNRMYRKRDLKLIQLIKELLYDKGFTIAGARRKLLDERSQFRDQMEISFTDVDRSTMLMEIIRDLKGILKDLKEANARSGRPALEDEPDDAVDGDDEEGEAGERELTAAARGEEFEGASPERGDSANARPGTRGGEE